jgi:hypothetical protein
MPKSRSRYQRAAIRSKYRKPKRRRGGSMGWNVAIAALLIVGVVAVVIARGGGSSSGGSGPPRAADQANNVPGDHWHTALNVNICGEWLQNPPAFEKPSYSPNQLFNAGIHSHGDGLIHTHPYVSGEEGSNATVGKFFKYGGWSLSSDSINLGGSIATDTPTQWQGPKSDPKKTSWSNGDTCPFGKYKGQKVELQWTVDGKKKTGNPADYHQQDGATLAIYLLPKGAELPFPQQACTAFQNITDQPSALLSKGSPCRATLPTTTTVPGATTTAPGATTTTPAPTTTSKP